MSRIKNGSLSCGVSDRIVTSRDLEEEEETVVEETMNDEDDQEETLEDMMKHIIKTKPTPGKVRNEIRKMIELLDNEDELIFK